MSKKIYSAPAVEPISLEEAKLWLKIDTSPTSVHPDDSLVTSLIKACREFCEGFQNRAYITQTWDLFLDSFPSCGEIEIPLPPLQSVTHLKYKDTAGVLQTLDAADYIVDTLEEPGRIVLKYGISAPLVYNEIQNVQIRFVAGYGATAPDVPLSVKSAIYMMLADLYNNRGDEDLRSGFAIVEESKYMRAVKALLWPDRMTPIP